MLGQGRTGQQAQPQEPGSRVGVFPSRDLAFRAALAVASLVVVAAGALWAISLVREVTAANSVSGHHDFFAFYSASSLVRELRPDLLYDRDAVTAVQRGFFPLAVGYAGYMAYLNPPFAAVLQLPLAFLSEESARLVWLAVNVPIVCACAALLTVDVRGRIRWLVAAVLVATFPVYQALVEGQWSLILLLACLAALAAARRGHPLVAGACLGVLAIKPPVLLLALAWLLLARRWRMAAGAVATAAAAVAGTLPLTGMGPYFEYFRYLADVALSHATGAGAAGPTTWSGSLQNMEGLNGLAATLVGQSQTLAANVITAIGAGLVLVLVVLSRPWRGAAGQRGAGQGAAGQRGAGQRAVPTSAAVVAVGAGLLLNPNLYAQDCVLTLLLFPIVASRLASAELQLALAVGLALVLNATAVDTEASQQGLMYAPHVLTIVLIGMLAAALVARRRLLPRPSFLVSPSVPG